MGSQAEVDRLRREADTIMTRYEQVQEALESARSESGDHWETGELTVTLATPQGDPIEVTLDLDADPASNAQRRYDRATELEAELERERAVAEQLAPVPADPLAYLLCYHLDTVGGNYPRSMAGYLDAEHDHVERLCEELEDGGLFERLEPGTVKQRRAKAKQSDEVRQHHTYYRLSREGDHLLRFLAERAGKLNVLRHLPDCHAVVRRLVRDGPDSPRGTAADLDVSFEHARHCYRALGRVGLATAAEGGTDAASDRSPEPGDGAAATDTRYVATEVAEELLRELES